MNLKRMLFGPFSAIVLILGMAPAVVAQSGDTLPVNVTVTSPPCAVDIGFSPSLPPTDLGVWEWFGMGYLETSGSSTVFLELSFANAPYGGCDLMFGFTGLSDASGTQFIPATSTYFKASSGFIGSATQEDPVGWIVHDVPARPGYLYPISYRLIAVPSDLPFGTYTGTIKVSVSNAV